jgi:hypothetical protein
LEKEDGMGKVDGGSYFYFVFCLTRTIS